MSDTRSWDVKHMVTFGDEDYALVHSDRAFTSLMFCVTELVFESRKSRYGVYTMADGNPQLSLLLDALMKTGPERRCSILKACLSSSFEE